MIKSRRFSSRCPPAKFALAAPFFRMTYAVIISRGIKSFPIEKCSSARCVCAPQSLSAGTSTSPRLSVSLRMSGIMYPFLLSCSAKTIRCIPQALNKLQDSGESFRPRFPRTSGRSKHGTKQRVRLLYFFRNNRVWSDKIFLESHRSAHCNELLRRLLYPLPRHVHIRVARAEQNRSSLQASCVMKFRAEWPNQSASERHQRCIALRMPRNKLARKARPLREPCNRNALVRKTQLHALINRPRNCIQRGAEPWLITRN